MKLKDFTFIFALLTLAVFDALFGGALAAILQHEGWKQRINDIWQVGFGAICALELAVLFIWAAWKGVLAKKAEGWLQDALISAHNAHWQAIYLLAMLSAYAEDLVFYPALYALNCIGVTSLISGGYSYNFPAYLWPWSLSGWFGFVTRLLTGETIKLPTIWAMILTVGTLAAILWHMQMRKDKQT